MQGATFKSDTTNAFSSFYRSNANELNNLHLLL